MQITADQEVEISRTIEFRIKKEIKQYTKK